MKRTIIKSLPGMPASDGAGVKLSRLMGQTALDMLDPFLLLDHFSSDQPDDYIAGFPEHPHRGFETVTYMLAGKMRHKDNTGREGVIEAGDVQWMTAGRGILHSEMPEQTGGLLSGFQLWVNLPASDKMQEPRYQEYSADTIPTEERDGAMLKVIAGTTSLGTTGPVSDISVSPLYFDVALDADVTFTETIPEGHNAFITLYEGAVTIEGFEAKTGSINVLSLGDEATITAGSAGARFLLIAGNPIGEPVARGGPFVMNTKAEILQAFEDFKAGQF